MYKHTTLLLAICLPLKHLIISIMNLNLILGMFNLGGSEIFIILIVVLLLFGGKKIPELMRGLGKGIREFNDAKDGIKKEIEDGVNKTTSDEKK